MWFLTANSLIGLDRVHSMNTDLFYIAPVIMGVVVIATEIVDIVFALRAKRRMKKTLAGDMTSNPELMRLVQHARTGFNEAELNEATGIIFQSLQRLTDDDRRHIERGLHQGNKSGEKRFVLDLMTLL